MEGIDAAVLKLNQKIIVKPAVIEAYERAETSIGGITFTKGVIEQQQGTGQQ